MRILHVSPLTPLKYGRHTDDVGLGHCFLAGYVSNHASFPIEFRVTSRNIEKVLEEFCPDIAAISGMTYNFHEAASVASRARRMGCKVIVGGPHISALPSQLTENMDVGVLCEGEQTYLELIHLCQQDRWAPEYWKDVRGIVFRTAEGQFVITPPRPLIKELDLVGHPLRSLAPRTPTILESVVTSRGCPYNCSFCYESRFWKNTVRFHSPEYVIREIENVYALGRPNRIRFDDSLFLINKRRMAELVNRWERHPLHDRVSFSCSARANTIDQEMATLAKKLGITSVFFGFESGHPTTLSYLKVRGITPDDNQRAYDILTRMGIHVEGSIIIGSPRETREEIMETYRFIKRNRHMTVSEVSHLVPLPGTPVWDHAVAQGRVSENMDFSILGGQRTNSKALFMSETLDRDEIKRLLRRFRRLMNRRRFMVTCKRRIGYVFRDPLSFPARVIGYVSRALSRLGARFD